MYIKCRPDSERENFSPIDCPARFGCDVGAGKTERPAVKYLAERRTREVVEALFLPGHALEM